MDIKKAQLSFEHLTAALRHCKYNDSLTLQIWAILFIYANKMLIIFQ